MVRVRDLRRAAVVAVAFFVAAIGAAGVDAAPRTFTVNSRNDVNDGACNSTHCSLREAILAANANSGKDTIRFVVGSGPITIRPTAQLPTVTSAVIITGWTQPGWAVGKPIVELNGSSTAAGADGLRIDGGGTLVRGLVINRFKDVGVVILKNGVVLEGNHIGTNTAGTAALPNASVGVLVNSSGNTIGGTTSSTRNVISGNGNAGVYIQGPGTTGNSVAGNYIGVDATGNVDLGNASYGIVVAATANTNIGGTVTAAGNVLSGNAGGINIVAAASGTTVLGNYVGTNASGTADVGNTSTGILVQTSGNTIGGDSVTERNVVSGNDGSGIIIAGAAASGNVLRWNYVGTNASGGAPLGNSLYGIRISDAPNNTVGQADDRNVVSGNTLDGILIDGTGASGNRIARNFVGVAATGAADLGNGDYGVRISDAPGNTIGGGTAGDFNVVSGNDLDGIRISGPNATGNTVVGNRVGTNSAGTGDVGNDATGVVILSANNTVRSGTDRQIIAGNGSSGVALGGTGATGNQVKGNWIGVDASGATALANAGSGVFISGPSNVVGGATAGDRNVISGNNNRGVVLSGSSATSNDIQGNYIGTDAGGAGDLGNTSDGVLVVDASGNSIGGTAAGAGNVISGNGGSGINLGGAGTSGNEVLGNLIGTDASGTAPLGNTGSAVFVTTPSNTIGGASAGARNVISGGNARGVRIQGAAATGNAVLGNYIGTDATGTADLGNLGPGIWFEDAPGNTAGGAAAGEGNVVSGNGSDGVVVSGSGATGNQVLGNRIGTDVSGTAPLGNAQSAVVITAPNNTVGGATVGARNVISGGNLRGVRILGAAASGNVVLGNYIGTDINGTADLGNVASGIWFDGAPNNTAGGTAAGAGNVISGNGGDGIFVSGSGATGNQVLGNNIGTDAAGTSDIGNGATGVRIDSASGTIVGGTTGDAANTIAYNGRGIVVVAGSGNAFSSNSVFSNDALGIDLGPNDGVTANDAGDGDPGPNELQNFPVLTAISRAGGSTTIDGTLNSTPGVVFRVELFSSPSCDGSGNGEGQTYLGATNATTAGNGNATLTATFSTELALGSFVTATATRESTGDTSEFSACREVTPPPEQIVFSADSGVVQFGNPVYEIFRMSPDGTGRTQLTSGSLANQFYAVSSPDYSRIAWKDTFNLTVWVMNADGSGKVNTGIRNSRSAVAWSPDGTKLLVASNSPAGGGNVHIYKFNPSASPDPVNLTDNARQQFDPSWSPDGTKIYYREGDGSDDEIWVMDADGNNKVQLTNNSVDDDYPVARGAYVFINRAGTVYRMDLDGGNAVQVTPTGHLAFGSSAFTVSSDGSMVVWRVSQQSLIYKANSDGTGLTLISSSGFPGDPDFSPDDTKVVFHYSTTGANRIASLDVTNGPASPTVFNPGTTGELLPRWSGRGPTY